MTKNQGPKSGTAAARIFELKKPNEADVDFANRLGISAQALNNLKKQRGVSMTALGNIARHARLSAEDVYYIVTGDKKPRHVGPTEAQEIVERIRRLIPPLPVPLTPRRRRNG